MQVRNKVQKFSELKPYLVRVNSGEKEEPIKQDFKLWEPKFTRPSVDRDGDYPLSLKDLVAKLDKKFLSVREPKHCHNLCVNPTKLGPRNLEGQ